MLYEALIILIVVFNLIDLVATLWLIENGLAVEANPFMKEAMDMAMKSKTFSGEEIRNAMYAKENWVPAGLEGVCLPSSWKEDDHRGLMEVPIYRVKVNGSTEKKKVDELMREKIIELVKEDQIKLPRRPEWRGY